MIYGLIGRNCSKLQVAQLFGSDRQSESKVVKN